jgi:hypothetical protein
MIKTPLVAIVLATALATMPASAQQSQPPATDLESALVGLPVYSSDGEKLGEIIGAATRGGQTAVRAEMGPFLGLGPSPVLIDAGVFQKKGDRIELTLTAAEVRERVSKQNQKQGQ